MTTRAVTLCDQCGQSDDHPKVHYGLETYHHDCAPYKVKEAILAGLHNTGDAEIVADIFKAAESGIHGAELLAHIEGIHTNG